MNNTTKRTNKNNKFELSIGFEEDHIDAITHIIVLSSVVAGYFPCKFNKMRPIEDPDELFAYVKKRIKLFVKSSRPGGREAAIPLYNEKRSKVDKYIKLSNDNGEFSVSVQEIVTL
jgi:hypothetical protein